MVVADYFEQNLHTVEGIATVEEGIFAALRKWAGKEK
jgi:hypothetical protein